MLVGSIEIPDDEIANIRKEHEAGATFYRLSQKYHRGYHTVLRILGKQSRGTKLRPGEAEKIVKGRKAGASVHDLMKKFGRSHEVVYRVLSEANMSPTEKPEETPQNGPTFDEVLEMANTAVQRANQPELSEYLKIVLTTIRKMHPEVTNVSMNLAMGRIDVECMSKTTIQVK